MTIKLQNSDLRKRFGDDIQKHYKLIQDAITTGKPETVQRELTTLEETIANVSQIFPNATQDILALESLQGNLLKNVTNMSESSPMHVPLSAETVRPETMQKLPPAGINRNAGEMHCGDNSIGQLLASAPSIAIKIMNRDPDLKKLIQMIYQAQIDGSTVPANFGKDMRRKIGDLLSHADLIEWTAERSDSSDTQIDILSPLQHIFEKAGFDYRFLQEVEQNGDKRILKDENTDKPRLQTEFSIDLDLSKGSRDFQELLDAFFIDSPEGGFTKRLKFTEAPQDLVIAAMRYSFLAQQHKIMDSIENVPEVFKLQPAYTQYNQDVNYELTGCAIHHGDLGGGHYTYLRKSGNTWYHIDDATVTEVKDPRSLIEKGYIYHFQKTEDPVSSFSEVQNGGGNELIKDLTRLAQWSLPKISWTLQKTSQIAWWALKKSVVALGYMLSSLSNQSTTLIEAKKDS
ncbi:MAG: hypothetical protein K1000chlam3_00400 [Chlamydiae bacterium]|nr:hypothetical protein [Chlamydiota bacterium]